MGCRSANSARNNVSYEGEGLLIVQLDPTGPVARAGIVEGDTMLKSMVRM